MGDLPILGEQKVERKAHEWIVLVPYVLTPQQASAIAHGSFVNLEKLPIHKEFQNAYGGMHIAVGCAQCGEEWETAVTKPCVGRQEV